MTDFLLELRSEEIPARMQAKARDDLARLFAAELARAGLAATETVTYATPRRLALIARGLPDATEAVSEEVKGPRASAPPQALEGFLRKTGLARDQLVERDGTLFAVTERPGRATAAVLADAIPAIVRAFPWPKSMRWGAASASTESLRWVRPLQGIVAIFGEDLVPVAIAGPTGSRVEPDNRITSGYATLGHRFHHPGVITIGGAHDYVEKLRACHVIVSPDERAALIRDGARTLAAGAGLELVEDEGLVAENAGLTEWPVPLLGRFDADFLQVPPEVIQLTARVNQKYFVCRTPLPAREGLGVGGGQDVRPDHARPHRIAETPPTPDPSLAGRGELANAFICTANIDATDGGAKIVDGNRKVLAARLADARFFYETDLKVPLAEQAAKLEKIVFHEKLGTLADKVERVAKLARWLVEEGIVRPGAPAQAGALADEALHDPALRPAPEHDTAAMADLAERAARLAKADLVTGMVGEFPELQGLMGGYYARAQGEPREVWEAVRDHYKPVGQGDDVPTAPVTVAVSLADKLDTLIGFFAFGMEPTGSKDPFALRRAVLAVTQLVVSSRLRLPLAVAISKHAALFAPVALTHKGHSLAAIQRLADEWGVVTSDLVVSSEDIGDSIVIALGDRRTTIAGWYQVFAYWAVEQLQVFREDGGLSLLDFFADRLKVQQREAGVRHDLIDAVFALGGEDDLVRLLARVRALQAFVGTEDGANLLAGYKRAANILRKEGYGDPATLRHPGPVPGSSATQAAASREGDGTPAQGRRDEAAKLVTPGLSYTPEPAEGALIAALDSAEPAAARAVAAEDFEGAMAALASLRAPIDAFFDTVTVNDPDPARRAARLALLARVRAAVHTVADFSRIEG